MNRIGDIIMYNVYKRAIFFETIRVMILYDEYAQRGEVPGLLKSSVNRVRELERKLGMKTSENDLERGTTMGDANYALGILDNNEAS